MFIPGAGSDLICPRTAISFFVLTNRILRVLYGPIISLWREHGPSTKAHGLKSQDQSASDAPNNFSTIIIYHIHIYIYIVSIHNIYIYIYIYIYMYVYIDIYVYIFILVLSNVT